MFTLLQFKYLQKNKYEKKIRLNTYYNYIFSFSNV